MLQILKEDGSLEGNSRAPLKAKQLLRLYRHMVRVRLLDEKMTTLQRQGRVGFYGSCTGQEAAIIGSAAALESADWIVPAIREGGAALMRGYPMDQYIGQVLGNALDVNKGRQMPCHYASRDVHYLSWSSCIANQLPQAVGIALGARLRGDDIVVLAYLGDGATSEADFHWAMNFAGVYAPPVVFFCQNNQWAISVSVKQQTASESIAVKATAYGLPGHQVDGNDIFAVYKATREAVDRARRGEGPALIEAVTYRMGAHSSSDDPSRYRDESITEQWKAKDPLLRLRAYMVRKEIWDEEQDRQLQADITEEIQESVARAEKAPSPNPVTLFDDVYQELPWQLLEQREESVTS